VKSGRARYAWVTVGPLCWLLCITLTAGYEKIFSPEVRIGFLAHAAQLQDSIAAGQVPAAKITETHALMFNDRLDAAVTALFMGLVVVIVVDSVREWYRVLSVRTLAQQRLAAGA
jgi:carbon starvation protein